jgi:hypothetical protein
MIEPERRRNPGQVAMRVRALLLSLKRLFVRPANEDLNFKEIV